MKNGRCVGGQLVGFRAKREEEEEEEEWWWIRSTIS